jgi:DnaJ-class molecular chaperone
MTDAKIVAAFRLLGLMPGASPTSVDLMYRRLAPDAHPDRGGTAAAFHSLKAAHDTARAYASGEPCPKCGGSGRAYISSGWAHAAIVCSACGGTGKHHTTP